MFWGQRHLLVFKSGETLCTGVQVYAVWTWYTAAFDNVQFKVHPFFYTIVQGSSKTRCSSNEDFPSLMCNLNAAFFASCIITD